MTGVNGLKNYYSHMSAQCNINKSDAACALALALTKAIDEYINKMTQGLFGLCDDEIAARIEEFKTLFYPEGGSAQEKAAFYDKLNAFIHALHRKADSQKTEVLLTNTAAQAAEDEMDCIATMIRGKISQAVPSNALN